MTRAWGCGRTAPASPRSWPNTSGTHTRRPPGPLGTKRRKRSRIQRRPPGKSNKRRLPNPYHPKFREFSINLARTYAETYGAYPAYGLMNINTETEYHNHPDTSEQGLAWAMSIGYRWMLIHVHDVLGQLAVDQGEPLRVLAVQFFHVGQVWQ